jgi:hypothetical protein
MAQTTSILLDCEYFPCIAWYQAFLNHEDPAIEQHEYFVRTSLRNRCYVANANGKLALTVPLKGGRNQKTLMKNIQVSFDTDWKTLHWKTIESAYRRSPFFEYYEAEIRTFYEQDFKYLLEWNVASLRLINALLKIKKEFTLTQKYLPQEELNCLDVRNNFMAHDNLNDADTPKYFQTFMERNGFLPNLSILDMLFCEGKSLLKMLQIEASK